MKRIRKHFTYANVMSSIAVFLILGGATAVAAKVGTGQLKAGSVKTGKIAKEAVKAGKLAKNAVTTPKIANAAVTSEKIANGAVTGEKVNLSTLGTVPNSATTDEVRSSKGTLSVGQSATIIDYAGVKLVVNCETFPATDITARVYIESSSDGTTFLSWEDAFKSIGPATPATEREVTDPQWANSNGPMAGEAGAPVNVTTAAGASFAGHVGVASEKDSNTCWYWFHGTIIS